MGDELRCSCDAHGIRFTRSRPWHKNDNCTVESKNWTLVRRCLGYRRFDTEDQLADLTQLETPLTQRANVLQPSMALQEKVRTGSRVQKRYRPPLTPLHRLLQAPRSVIRQRHASCASSGTRVPSLCSGTSTYCRHGSSGRQARIPPSEP